ncbi:HDOD domain-containing protein [Hydrogenimonas sp. SS33]|uniref:HDOD domain-containing protein n=1 Tax=Hydrogenimonas leucolamina TaxID=2954236 RepID=UPI00336BD2EA
MVTREEIESYIEQVPPLPSTLRESLAALEKKELAEAAKTASADVAMVHYLQCVVNSAAYGFRNELKEPKQIFSALGTERAKSLLYAYMVSLMSPKAWRFFRLTSDDFTHFQTSLMARWEKLLKQEGADEKYLSAAALMSAGLVVADALFGEYAADVALLREHEALDLDTILERLTGMRFDGLVDMVAQKWEMQRDVREVVRLAFGNEACGMEEETCRLARLLHLLLFYELSRPVMMEAEANAFVEFRPEFVAPVIERFEKAVEIA